VLPPFSFIHFSCNPKAPGVLPPRLGATAPRVPAWEPNLLSTLSDIQSGPDGFSNRIQRHHWQGGPRRHPDRMVLRGHANFVRLLGVAEWIEKAQRAIRRNHQSRVSCRVRGKARKNNRNANGEAPNFGRGLSRGSVAGSLASINWPRVEPSWKLSWIPAQGRASPLRLNHRRHQATNLKIFRWNSWRLKISVKRFFRCLSRKSTSKKNGDPTLQRHPGSQAGCLRQKPAFVEPVNDNGRG